MITREEWERRYKAHIVAVLTEGDEPSDWTKEEAEAAAQDDYDGSGFDFLSDGFEEDPEDSAEESMSYWADGSDFI